MEAPGPATWGPALWVVLGAYALGGLATGYYLVRWRTGLDLRRLGSGSLGARNARRLLGPPGFLATASGDLAKGALAVWLARHVTGQDQLAALAMLAVVAGHIWPAQLRFHGGKGIATSIGALAIYNIQLALAYGILFGIGLALSRRVVVAGLVAWVCLPLLSFYWRTQPGAPADVPRTLAAAALAAMILFAHRSNLIVEARHCFDRPKISSKPHSPES